MKFRWKLLVLLLAISIFPIVGLRTFGIQNIGIMSKSLIAQVEINHESEATSRLLTRMEGYAHSLGKIRDEVEIALTFQMFEVKGGILQNILAAEKDEEMDGLLEPALFISEIPPNTTAFLGTLASEPTTGQVGLKLASKKERGLKSGVAVL